jgi:hypothetical protein
MVLGNDLLGFEDVNNECAFRLQNDLKFSLFQLFSISLGQWGSISDDFLPIQ